MSAELVLDGLNASLLLDEVVDDLGGLLVLQLGLGDAAHVEQVLQLRVQVVHIKACVWVPSHVPNVLEVAGRADVGLGQPLLLPALVLLLSPGEGGVHQVVHLRVAEALEADLGVLDVYCGHGKRRTVRRVAPLLSFPLSSPHELKQVAAETLRLLLTGKVQTHLARISSKCDEIRFGEVGVEVVVELLFKHDFTILEVKDPDEVGPHGVVFHQTGDAAAPLAPVKAAVRCEHLDHG